MQKKKIQCKFKKILRVMFTFYISNPRVARQLSFTKIAVITVKLADSLTKP